MRLLISGGSGFLGQALTRHLQQITAPDGQAWQITWLTRDTSQDCPDGVSLMNYEQLQHSTATFEVVVNLAGAGIADKRWSKARKKQLLNSRIQPTQALIDFIKRSEKRPRLMVSGSAIGWYGAQGDQPLDEHSDFNPDFDHRLCQRWEQCAAQATSMGVPVAIVRTGVVLNPNGGMMAKLLPAFKFGLGGQLGNGQQIMSWIARRDWVEAVQFIIQRQLSESEQGMTSTKTQKASDANTKAASVTMYNLTAPNPVSNRTFTKQVGQWLSRPTVMTLPEPLLRLMFGDMATLLVDGQRVLPQALLDAGYSFNYPTLSKALSSMSA